MSRIKEFFYRWGLAIIVMAAIFQFSSTPGAKIPNFGSLDFWVKKGGHVIGYGLLSLAYWHGLNWNKKRVWWAWLLSLIYAITDEYHQSFIVGRHPSFLDVLLFDSTGAAIGLWFTQKFYSLTATESH